MYKLLFVGAMLIVLSACTSTYVPNFNGLTSGVREQYTLDTNYFEGQTRHKVIRAANLRMKKDYAEAVVELLDLYNYFKDPSIAFAIAENLYAMNKQTLAKTYVEEALKSDSTFIPAFELLSEIYLSERNLDKAIEIINFVQSVDYKTERDFDLAFAYEFVNPHKAIEKYEFLFDKYPEERISERLLFLYEKTGKTDKKISMLKERYLANPINSQTTKELFSFWLNNGDLNELLIFTFENESRIKTEDLVLIYGSAAQKMISGAEYNMNILDTLLSKFDIRFTNDWQLYLQGFFLAADNNLVSYEKQFLAMIERFSDKKQDVFLEISVFFQRKNRYIDAENLLTHYYTVFSQDFRYPFLLGLNYLYQENDTKALENMYEAIAIDSNSVDVWVNIGIIYDRLNNVDSAEVAYKRALSINNMHALANNNYAYSLASTGKELRKALEMVQTALQSEPNNSAYLDTYGWVLFKLGKKELAIEQILKSIEIGGAGPEVYEHLGDIYKEIGKMDDAIRAYKDGLSNFPNNDLLKTKLEEISK